MTDIIINVADVAATSTTEPPNSSKIMPVAPGSAWTDFPDYVVRDENQIMRDNSTESCSALIARATQLGTKYTFSDWLPPGTHWKLGVTHAAISEKLTALGGFLQAEYNEVGHFFVWTWPDGMVRYRVSDSYDGDKDMHLSGSQWVATCNPELHEALIGAVANMWQKPRNPPRPYGSSLTMLCGTPIHGYVLKDIGFTSERLVPENYTPEVRAAFDTIFPALTASNPAGRITLVEGPPGTGKTRAVTALLAKLCNSARIVIVPSHMVAELSGPDLIGSLIGHARPTILVLEDADQAMLSREAASEKDKELNTGALASLLNLSDGLVGGMCNFRIIATTNAKVQDIDPALLRPGRLLCRVHINNLDRATAGAIIDRETGLGEVERLNYLERFSNTDHEAFLWWNRGIGPTLAEAYEIARRIVKAHEASTAAAAPPTPPETTPKPKRSHKKKTTVAANMDIS
jgi:hypothetical protein